MLLISALARVFGEAQGSSSNHEKASIEENQT